jgi:CRISPR/Cas system-associated exonuclease Cas4 (RecB family)
MDPGTRGSIFHRIQLDVLRELKRASILPVRPDNLSEALKLLDATIERVGNEEAERLAPAVMQVWNEELRRIRIDLRGWLDKMATDDVAWTPIAFELAFGRRKDDLHDERSVEDSVRILDCYLLQGSVDMVERHISGHLRVTDHKTGSFPQPVPRTIGKGEVLQPALYALAVEQILGESVSSARLYHATLRANFRSAPINVPNQYTERVLEAIDHAVGEGLLPANPREEACDQCNYRSICGPYEEQRVKRKPKDAALEFIRKCE